MSFFSFSTFFLEVSIFCSVWVTSALTVSSLGRCKTGGKIKPKLEEELEGWKKKRVRKGLGYQIIHLSLLLLLLLLHPKVVLVDASMLLLHAVELFLGALLKGTNKIECCIMQRV